MDNVVRHDSSLGHLVDDVKDARDGSSGNTITATMRVTGRDTNVGLAPHSSSPGASSCDWTVIGISPLPSVGMLPARLIETNLPVRVNSR